MSAHTASEGRPESRSGDDRGVTLSDLRSPVWWREQGATAGLLARGGRFLMVFPVLVLLMFGLRALAATWGLVLTGLLIGLAAGVAVVGLFLHRMARQVAELEENA